MRSVRWAVWGLVAVMLGAAGCDALSKSSAKSEAKDESDEESDDEAPKKKKDKKKSKDADADATASATAAAPVAAADPLASFFSLPVDPATKFLRQKNLKGRPIWVQVLPDWETSRDDQSIDYVDDELSVYGKENHAQVYMAVRSKMAGFPEAQKDFECQRISAQKCAFGAPVDGTFGESKLPAKIAKGTAMRVKSPIDVWYVIADFQDKSLFVMVALRKDVYPKLEPQLFDIVRSTKVDPAQK